MLPIEILGQWWIGNMENTGSMAIGMAVGFVFTMGWTYMFRLAWKVAGYRD